MTGQSYTTGLPSGSDYVRAGEYLDNITNNSSGLISEFHDGYTCTKDYHDGVSVTFTENDSEKTGTGTMDYVIYDDGWVAKRGSLAYGQSTNYTNDSGRYTIVNPYVPQTTNIVYQYKKLGQVITTDPSGNKTWVYYANDQSDPTKIEPVNAKPITGYSAIVKYENKIVSDKNFMPTNLGENTYITYVANDQAAGIKFIDDTTGKTLDTHQASGKFGDVIKFSRDVNDEISQFESQNYKLVSNNFDNQKYVSDNTKNQFEVHFVHVTKNVTRTDKVNRTIHYVYSDGKTAEPDKVQVVNFTEDGVQDLVTGNITWTSAKSQTMVSVDTPKLEGYTPDIKSVASQTVNFGDKDLDTTVTYSANDQAAGIKFIDDTTGKTLDTHQASGKFGDVIKFSRDVNDEISQFESQNYKLVSNNFDNQKYVSDNTKNQFEVHFVHVTKNVTRTDKVNRTIHYVYSDGKTAEPDKVQVVNFTEDGVQDLVTGNITWTSAKSQTMVSVDTPKLEGYTPDIKSVASQTVKFGDPDINVTVHYTANAQKASVTYVDDKTGKTLKVDNLNGVTNAKSGYTTKAAIDTYTGLGYTLVSDDTNGNEVVFDNDDANDQAFTVHLSHGTITVTTENPGKPGEPVDPDNPDGPKYPDGTDEYQVKRTGTQTIHYVGAGDKTPADNKQTFVFTREITFDEVTGKIISVTPWNVQSHTFGNVGTPVIPGYHADKAVAGGATVTPDDLNKVITVTYAPDGGSGDNPGSNGGGDQGTTPTPDDQPDTTLPSDNNTDKDVEKDKQDKPKKVKKARKIIKTRITKQEHIGNAEKAEPLAEQEHNDQTVASPVKNEANEPQLPQTGEANTSVIGLLGMLVAGFAAILGFESSRSRKHKN